MSSGAEPTGTEVQEDMGSGVSKVGNLDSEMFRFSVC